MSVTYIILFVAYVISSCFFLIVSWLMIVIPFFMWKNKIICRFWSTRPFFLPGNRTCAHSCSFLSHFKTCHLFLQWGVVSSSSNPRGSGPSSLPSLFTSENLICHVYKGSSNISSSLVDMHCSFRVMWQFSSDRSDFKRAERCFIPAIGLI